MCCRPQLGGAFLAAVVMSLMALVPFLSFMWHVTCVLAVFVAVDSVALKDKCFAYFIRITIFLFVRAPGLKVTQKALLNNIIITKKQNYKPEIIIRANGKFLEDWLTNNFETKFAKLKLLRVILLVSSQSPRFLILTLLPGPPVRGFRRDSAPRRERLVHVEPPVVK